MTKDSIAERGRNLEEAFFAKQDALLRQRLAALDETRPGAGAAALSAASGITDPGAIERLLASGVSATTLAALTLVPLVAVAWADGKIDENERKVLLAGAERAGLGRDHPGYGLFEGWLAKPPGSDMMAAWTQYVAALPPETKQMIKADIVGRARTVAEAAGGFLNIGSKVSSAEQAVLDDLDAAFA